MPRVDEAAHRMVEIVNTVLGKFVKGIRFMDVFVVNGNTARSLRFLETVIQKVIEGLVVDLAAKVNKPSSGSID